MIEACTGMLRELDVPADHVAFDHKRDPKTRRS
jgi:hypothetical protein